MRRLDRWWTTLETTQEQIDGFFSQIPSKCYLPEVAFGWHMWEIDLDFPPGLPPGRSAVASRWS